MLVASDTSCGDELMAPCGTCAGGGGLGIPAKPAAERSEDPAKSGGPAAAVVGAVGPGAGSGAASPGRPEAASALEAASPAESRAVPAPTGAGPAAGTAAAAEPGLEALTSGEAAGAAGPGPWLGADAGEAGSELEVAMTSGAMTSGAMGVERGVTRTRAGVPMYPKVEGTGSSRTSTSTWFERRPSWAAAAVTAASTVLALASAWATRLALSGRAAARPPVAAGALPATLALLRLGALARLGALGRRPATLLG
jgi:hypothetical protein